MSMLTTEALAESLVQQVAKEACVLPLSPLQQEVGIPCALIFLAGLAVSNDNDKPTFSSAEIQRFQHYQEVYNQALNISSDQKKFFRLSPMLLPTTDARHAIQVRIQQHEKKLAVETQQAVEGLLLEESLNSNKKKRKKKKTKKKKQVVKEECVEEESNYDVDSSSSDTDEMRAVSDDTYSSGATASIQQHILTPIQVSDTKQEQSALNSPTNDDSWVQVKTKRSLKREASNDDKDDGSGVGTDENDDKVYTDSVVPAVRQETTENDAKHIVTVHPPPITKNKNKDDDDDSPPSNNDNTTNPTKPSLQTQVQDLQRSLQETQSQLHQERQCHKQELKRLSQSTEERIQSLQLRLYISETRSRNFEEALQNHVDAVAENVVFTPRKSRVCGGENSSSGVEDGDSEGSSSDNGKPLYSRVASIKE